MVKAAWYPESQKADTGFEFFLMHIGLDDIRRSGRAGHRPDSIGRFRACAKLIQPSVVLQAATGGRDNSTGLLRDFRPHFAVAPWRFATVAAIRLGRGLPPRSRRSRSPHKRKTRQPEAGGSET